MRLAEIWLDDLLGEQRAALVEDGAIVELHLQRPMHFALGETGVGRIDRKTPSGAYVECDAGGEILIRKGALPPEGRYIAFAVTREAICEPGRTKPAEARILDDEVDRHIHRQAAWDERVAGLGGYPASTNDVSAAFDVALAGTSVIGDVAVHFQRTKAGLVFDIDGIGDPMAINLVAAREVARLLRLYQVGGMTIVDFLSLKAKADRQALGDAFDAASAADPRPFERSAVNGFGLMQIVRARPRPSILDQLFGTRIAALSNETQALWLLRDAARSSGFGPRSIVAKAAVAALLESAQWAEFRADCERLIGAALLVVADEHVGGYGHVHAAQS